MKKAIVFLLLAAILLVGCAKQTELVVDTENQTTSDGSFTYEYTDTTTGELRIIIIQYPNGGQYTYRQEGNISTGSPSGVIGTEKYTKGHLLVHAVLNPNTEEKAYPVPWPLIIVGALIAAGGLWQVCCPYKVWDRFFYRWYQEEASNYALTRIIATGLGEIALGIGTILLTLFVSLK